MVGPEDGAVPGQVIKVVHDDGHEQVQHEEAAEEDKGDKEEVSDVAAAGLVRLEELEGGGVPLESPGVAGLPGTAGQHDVGPGLACRTSKHQRSDDGTLVSQDGIKSQHQAFLYLVLK